MTARRISVCIDELVLHGFTAEEPGATPSGYPVSVAAALERELTRLCAEGGLSPAGPGTSVRDLGMASVQVPPGAGVDIVGARVATAIYDQLRRLTE